MTTMLEGTRLRLWRLTAGLTQREVAVLAGTDRRRLAAAEHGARPLPPAVAAGVRDIRDRALAERDSR